MDADFSIELGREDPVLDVPWSDPDGRLAYYNLKSAPGLLSQIGEANEFPELRDLLRTVNSRMSAVESAKCDAWATDELAPEEEVFGASVKFVSYVDLIFSDPDRRASFPLHEHFARRLVELLRRTPQTASAAEIYVRRCYFAAMGETREGCYFSLYLSGYGDDVPRARQNWGIGLKLAGNAILQLSASGLT